MRTKFAHRVKIERSTVSAIIVNLFGRIPLDEEVLDFMDLAHTIHNFRKLDANIRHNNAGFSDEEVAQLEKKFYLNSDQATNRVPCSRARHLMEMLVPKGHVLSQFETDILEEAIKEAEHDVHGGVEFADFLQFARTVKDANETTEFEAQKLVKAKEQEEMDRICTEYSISPGDIAEYQEVFHKFDIDGNGELSMSEVLQMVKHVRDLTLHQEVAVMRIIKELDEDGSNSTGFKEFLRLLHRLQAEGILNDEAVSCATP